MATKNTLLFILMITFSMCSYGQVNDFQSSPKVVMEEIIRAAQKADFTNLKQLCPADKSNDGDTQTYICDLDKGDKSIRQEFITAFKRSYVIGEIKTGKMNGIEIARVPFMLGLAEGESREEAMNMEKTGNKWYITSF